MSKTSRSMEGSKKSRSRRSSSVTNVRRKRRKPPIPEQVEVVEATEHISLFTIVYENISQFQSIFYLSGTVLSLYLSVCLFSFSPADLATGVINNVGGMLGAHASALLFNMFGYSAWFMLCIAGFFGLRLAGRKILDVWRIMASGALLMVSCCVCALLSPQIGTSGFYAGGLIGTKIAGVMTQLIGPAGAWLVVSGIIFGLGIFVAGQDLKVVSGQWLTRMEEVWPQFKGRSASWGHNLFDSMRSGYSNAKNQMGSWFEGEELSEEIFSEYDSEYDYADSEYSEYSVFSEEGSVEYSEWGDDYNSQEQVESLPPSDVYEDAISDWSGHGVEDSIFFESAMQISPFADNDSEDNHTKTIVKHAELVEVQAENTVHSDPDIANFHQSFRSPMPIQEESSLQEELAKPVTLSNNTRPIKNKKGSQSKRRKKNRSRSLDADLSLFAELQSTPDFNSPEDEQDDSDPNCLASWFHSDTQTANSDVQNNPDPLIIQPEDYSEEHSDTQEQAIEAHLLSTDDAKPITPEHEDLRPHSDISDSNSAYYEFESLIEDEDSAFGFQSKRPLRISVDEMESTGHQMQPQSISRATTPVGTPQTKTSTDNVPPSRPIQPISQTPQFQAPVVNADQMSASVSSKPISNIETSAVGEQIDVLPGCLIGGEIEVTENKNPYKNFSLPSLKLLDFHERDELGFDSEQLKALAVALSEKLEDFGVKGEVSAIRPGPVITTFEFSPARGVKISKIASLSDDIAMALCAIRVRIVAPIPGKGVVGIEIPNSERQIIWASEMFGSKAYQEAQGILPLVFGKTVDGYPYVSDLAKMPHLLVGGTTGSGKSVGINTMLMSMLFKNSPEDLRLILIDPKMLEFEMYRDIPHLIYPVVTDPNEASGILKWACDEMDRRYAMMAKFGTRNLKAFNRRVLEELKDWDHRKARKFRPDYWDTTETYVPRKLPYLVVVIDELADLMMVADKDVEESIIRLAQKARACGIHLIVATQRPSVNVITGMIKANMPCRIAFQVRQKVDGRTILDQNGAENLLGKGDMLFLPPGTASLVRCHGPFVTDEEVQRVTDYLRDQAHPIYEAEVPQEEEAAFEESTRSTDAYFDSAVQFVIESNRASTSMIQRKFSIGYNRAANIMESMERAGIVGPPNGARPREILISIDQYLNREAN